jgi:dienelactone hydrolase
MALILRTFIAASLLMLFVTDAAHAQELVEEPLRIPLHEAGSAGLEAIMVRPNDDLSHPLALLTHGTPREANKRLEVTAAALVPQAREFARRGWTAVIVVRRGFGTSGGRYTEESRACSNHPDYYDAGREAANDLRASIHYLSSVAHVDASRVISIGVSTGGFTNVALTADPPANLVAAISFAGGRGSKAPDEVCNPNDLVSAFRAFGKTSRVPMLWIYAENDHFFGPKLADSFYAAFTQAGGRATFIKADAFRKDGHTLFAGGIALWTPPVDGFLAAQHLTLREDLLPLPTPPDIAPPSLLAEDRRSQWRSFLILPDYRAFAVSRGGHYGMSYGRHSKKDAAAQALDHCKEVAPRGDRCELVDTPPYKN